MPDWSTYELTNFLLFSPRTYDRMIEACNAAMWPWHVVALLSGIAMAVLSARRGERARSAAATILAIAWIWVGWAFHYRSYAPINWAARWFALAFALQGVMIIATQWVRRLSGGGQPAGDSMPDSALGRPAVAGLALATAAVLALPLAQRLLGRPWTQVEIFGFFPDATALATIGVLAARERLAWHLVPIPLLWCVIGAATLAAMDRPDTAVVAGGMAIAVFVVCWKARADT